MRTFNKMEWTFLGVFIGGIIMIASFAIVTFSFLFGSILFGVFVGWWGCSMFWTYWVEHGRIEKEVPTE